MSRLTNFLNGRGRVSSWLDNGYRAATSGNVLDDKAFEIVVNRVVNDAVTQLDEQWVRIDLLSGSPQEQPLIAGMGTMVRQRVLITGYKNHPSETDTDIQLGDTFLYENQFYRVVGIEPSFTDRLLAVAETNT